MNRREKEKIVADFSKKVEGLKAIVLTNYIGLNVEQMNNLRRLLKEERIDFHVVKNTLMRLAFAGTELQSLNNYFEGPTAVAISYGDPTTLAKILSDFTKNQPSFKVKVAIVQGRILPPEELKALATMPSIGVLFAQIMGEIQCPAQQVGGAILGALQQIIAIIQARVDQLSSGDEPKA